MNTHTEENVISAMCIWEYMITGDLDGWLQLIDEGAYALRQYAADIAPLMDEAYDSLNESYPDSYDWDFVPFVMDRLKKELGTEKPSQEYINELAAHALAAALED